MSAKTGDHQAHLADWSGILQVDRYAGFNDMFKASWPGKPITRANCWAHSRRQFFELVDVAGQLKRRKDAKVIISPLAVEALQRIDRIFDIERDINGRSASERLAVRQDRSAPLIQDLENWMREQRQTLLRIPG